MPKILQDMVRKERPRPQKPVVEHISPTRENILREINEQKNRERKNVVETKTKTSKKKSSYLLWFVALFSLSFCLFAFSFLFSSALVTITPKTKEVNLNQNLSASSDPSSSGLSFNLVVIEGSESKTIQTTEEREEKRSATGTVLIFNAFNSTPQRLDIDTRLEGSNGKMYKTKTKITVPGKSKDGTPGSVEVGIYAAEAGEEYNSAPLDFKIFGFKGTEKYSKFYGRSKGEISGGFIGKAPYVSEENKAAVLAVLKTALEEKLIKKATAPGFVLFKDAIFLKTDEGKIDFDSSKSNQLTAKLSGTLTGILFDEKKLTKKIAESNVEKYDGSDVFIPNIKDLIFSLTPPQTDSSNSNIYFQGVKNISFNLKGPIQIVWKLDIEKFTDELLGRPKKDFYKILAQYPNVTSSKLVLNPSWKTSIPDKSKNIKVIVNYPE
jgi:hypothetical protein